MAFMKKAVKKVYPKLGDMSEGDVVVEGYYIGIGISKFDKDEFRFRTEDEQVVCLSQGAIKYAVEQGEISEGYFYRIEFAGEKVLESGTYSGRPCNTFDIYEDDEKFMEVRKPKAAPASEGLNLSDMD